MDSSHRRREVLRGIAAGGLAAVTGLAGCTELPTGGTEQAERPSYHTYVPAENADDEGAFFVALDLARFRELESRDLDSHLPESADVDIENGSGLEDADPMLSYPAAGLLVGILGLSFGLVPYGFGTDVASGFASGGVGGETPTPDGDESTETEDSGPAQVDTAAMLTGALVFEGTFDPEAIGEAAEGFEQTDERDGLTVYEGTDGETMLDTSNLAFAVGETRLVALLNPDDGTDPRAELDRVLDVAVGDADRLSENEDADWTLRTAGHGLVAIGGWGVDPDETEAAQTGAVEVDSALESARGLTSSLSVAGEDARTDVAAVFPEGETPDREELESELGTSASDREIEVDGTRVSVTATWPVEKGTPTDAP